jgi:glycine hydroxymethyltransferase
MGIYFPTQTLRELDVEVTELIDRERRRQRESIELIASENFTIPAIFEATGSALTNKYAEGYPAKRYYGGCGAVDGIESLAIERAKILFGAEHANVQPHSGTQANVAVYLSVLRPGDKILTMRLDHGGHLSHGYSKNISGMLFDVVHYGVEEMTGLIDYDEFEHVALREKPRMITVGASAYARTIDFERMGQIARKSGAFLMADIAHIAGLVVTGLHPSPIPHADFVTTTTHKTLRGPRGGLILCRKELAGAVDAALFPGTQGGPLMHVVAAKAVCFREAAGEGFKGYQRQVLQNSKIVAGVFSEKGYKVVGGGTDNHLCLIDLRRTHPDLDGKTAQSRLDDYRITINRNTVPGETRSPFVTSGLRIGTPAVTTRGMTEKERVAIAGLIDDILCGPPQGRDGEIRSTVTELCRQFPLPY